LALKIYYKKTLRYNRISFFVGEKQDSGFENPDGSCRNIRVHTQMTYINVPDDENLIWVLVS